MEKTENSELEALKADFEVKLKAQADLLAQTLSEVKTLTSKVEVKTEAEEVKVEEKKVVEQEEPEQKEPEAEEEAEDEEETEADEKNYKIVREHRSFTVVRNKYR